MTAVQAQFHMNEYTRLNSWSSGSVKVTKVQLSGVQGEPFGSATPQASIGMLIANDEAAQFFQDAFENGQDVQCLFTVVEKPAPDPVPAPVETADAPAPVEETTSSPAQPAEAASETSESTEGQV